MVNQKNIMNNRKIINRETFAKLMPIERSIDIDTEFDFSIAEFLLKKELMKHKIEELIDQNTPLSSALKVVNKSINRIAIVVNKNSEILGTITDGDIRRALISKNDFKTKAKEIMNSRPLFARVGLKNSYYLKIMKKHKRIQLPANRQ